MRLPPIPILLRRSLPSFMSMATGAPRPSLRTLRLVPDLARSTGLGPVTSPSNGALVIAPASACYFPSIPTSRS